MLLVFVSNKRLNCVSGSQLMCGNVTETFCLFALSLLPWGPQDCISSPIVFPYWSIVQGDQI